MTPRPRPRIVLQRASGSQNRGGPCRVRQRVPRTGPLPAKTGPVSARMTSGEFGPGPDDFGPVLGYYEAGPTPREAGPAGPEAASAPCGPGPGVSGPGRNQSEAGQPASVRRNDAQQCGLQRFDLHK